MMKRIKIKSYWLTKCNHALPTASAIALAGGIILFALVSAGSEPINPFENGIRTPSKHGGSDDSYESIARLRNPEAPARILLLGDSITQAKMGHRSYRYNLWVKLIDAGVNFDFVGSMNMNLGANPTWPDYKGRSFDPDHEGHWGWRADEILNGVPDQRDERLSEWLKTYTPDIVLIHLGTNDVFYSQSTSSTADELRHIIKMLRDDNRAVVILLAKLIPVFNMGANLRIDELNSRIDAIADETSNPASPVVVVDQNSGFDAHADTYDQLHPNKRGEEKMAARWFDALRPFLDK